MSDLLTDRFAREDLVQIAENQKALNSNMWFLNVVIITLVLLVLMLK